MSKLAYHAGHFSAGAAGGLSRHNWQKRGERDKHSNQDIDPTRSKDNMLLLVPERGGLYRAAKERIEAACTGRVTKASNWITETIVYPPEDVLARNNHEEIERYSRDVLAWHQQEFGAANVLASVVHMDETTPHIHTDVVPLTEDGRLSSKEVFARKNLNRHHTELASFLQERGWDIQRGEKTKDKQVRAKTVPEFKKAAEAEKTALLAEIEPLREVKADIDACEIQTSPVPLLRGKVMVDAAELAQRQEWAKALAAQAGAVQERADQLDQREAAMEAAYKQQQEDMQAQLDQERAKIQKDYDATLGRLTAREIRTQNDWDNLSKEQDKLAAARQKLDADRAEVDRLARVVIKHEKRVQHLVANEAKVEELTTQVADLTRQLTEAKAEGDRLRKALRAAYERMAEIVKAASMLMYDKTEGYKAANLTKRQQSLIEGIADYGAAVAEEDGQPELADTMRTKIGIGEGLKGYVKSQFKRLTKDNGPSLS